MPWPCMSPSEACSASRSCQRPRRETAPSRQFPTSRYSQCRRRLRLVRRPLAQWRRPRGRPTHRCRAHRAERPVHGRRDEQDGCSGNGGAPCERSMETSSGSSSGGTRYRLIPCTASSSMSPCVMFSKRSSGPVILTRAAPPACGSDPRSDLAKRTSRRRGTRDHPGEVGSPSVPCFARLRWSPAFDVSSAVEAIAPSSESSLPQPHATRARIM